MTYHVNAVANYFIKKAREQGRTDLTPMKLLKLVYIAHGWSLGLAGKPLFNEEVEAWKYGPVIRPLYHQLKAYGRGQIVNLLNPHPFSRPEANEIDPESDDAFLLEEVWKGYGHLSGIELSTITHQEGSPWEKTWDDRGLHGLVIRTSEIEEHYRKLLEESSVSTKQ